MTYIISISHLYKRVGTLRISQGPLGSPGSLHPVTPCLLFGLLAPRGAQCIRIVPTGVARDVGEVPTAAAAPHPSPVGAGRLIEQDVELEDDALALVQQGLVVGLPERVVQDARVLAVALRAQGTPFLEAMRHADVAAHLADGRERGTLELWRVVEPTQSDEN